MAGCMRFFVEFPDCVPACGAYPFLRAFPGASLADTPATGNMIPTFAYPIVWAYGVTVRAFPCRFFTNIVPGLVKVVIVYRFSVFGFEKEYVFSFFLLFLF